MIPQLTNRILPSFTMFVDNLLLSKGSGFRNANAESLTLVKENNFPDKLCFASPYRQFVYDNSINGAKFPSGIYIQNNFIPKGQSGLFIDYDMGRVFLDKVTSSQKVYADFAYKDFNIYYNYNNINQLIFDTENPIKLNLISNSGSSPLNYNDIVYPAIFIHQNYTEKFPFSFGGHQKQIVDIECVIISNNLFSLDACSSILCDSVNKTFPVLQPKDMPLNVYGDYKYSGFNYLHMCGGYIESGLDMGIVDSVSSARFPISASNKLGNNSYGAFVNFSVIIYRQTQ